LEGKKLWKGGLYGRKEVMEGRQLWKEGRKEGRKDVMEGRKEGSAVK
jgi:hypothetical protein